MGRGEPASLERIAFGKMKRLIGARAAVVSHEGGLMGSDRWKLV